MKKTSLFSPRKFIYWILIIILIITAPNLSSQSMGETNAIVTLLSVDNVGDEVMVSANVIKPSGNGGMCCETYSASNSTLAEAIEDIGYMIGKNMAFSQCEVMAFGDSISTDGIMSALDFMTRIKKVSRNTILVNIGGDIVEFNKAVVQLSSKQQLKLEGILGYSNKFTINNDNSIEAFYQKYYSTLGIGTLPRLEIGDSKANDAIEVAMIDDAGSNMGEESSNEKKYITNNGEIAVYVKGKKVNSIDRIMSHNLSLLSKSEYKGTIKVDNVSDELYDDATLLFYVTNAKAGIKAKYNNDKPIIETKISILAYIEEVEENTPSKKFLIRNEQFMSKMAQEKLKEKVQSMAKSAIEYCKESQLDVLDIYSEFNKFHHKKTKNIVDKIGIQAFLNSIEYKFIVDVKSTY